VSGVLRVDAAASLTVSVVVASLYVSCSGCMLSCSNRVILNLWIVNLQAVLGGWGGGGGGGSRLRCWVEGRGHARLVFGFEGVGGDIAIEGGGRVAEGWVVKLW
jgi:hypothetical protein